MLLLLFMRRSEHYLPSDRFVRRVSCKLLIHIFKFCIIRTDKNSGGLLLAINSRIIEIFKSKLIYFMEHLTFFNCVTHVRTRNP